MKPTSGDTLSVWAATADTIPASPLSKDTSTDVCIIGAGIAGLTTAYLLAREGKSVVVLDDGPIGGGMTARTTAHLTNALDDRFYELERLFGEEGSRLAAQSHTAAIDRVEAIVAQEKFDCVIATQVIEHVHQPLVFLRQLVSHTKPGGKIILATPDIRGLLRKVMGRRWPSFKIPEHINYFDPPRLSALMRKGGLIDLHSLPYPHAFPLALIATKLRLPFPSAIGNVNVWVPTTTVAIYGTVPS